MLEGFWSEGPVSCADDGAKGRPPRRKHLGHLGRELVEVEHLQRPGECTIIAPSESSHGGENSTEEIQPKSNTLQLVDVPQKSSRAVDMSHSQRQGNRILTPSVNISFLYSFISSLLFTRKGTTITLPSY